MYIINKNMKGYSAMERFEFEDEIYYYCNGKFTDECFITLEKNRLQKVADFYFSHYDIDTFSPNKLVQFVKETKDCEAYNTSIKACQIILDKYRTNDDAVKSILPIMTSCYRNTNQPNKAIEIGETFANIFSSAALFTSLGSAHCDVGNFERARNYANRAYAINPQSNEVKLLYKRLEKETSYKKVNITKNKYYT